MGSYPKTLEQFKRAVKVARKEIDEEEVLVRVINCFVEIEKVLEDGK